jgi:energy-coupling factor transport system permease protein
MKLNGNCFKSQVKSGATMVTSGCPAFLIDFYQNTAIFKDCETSTEMALLKDITLGQYYPGNSFLHRLDPRTKLLASLALLASLLLSNSLFAILFFMSCGAVGMLSSGVPGRIFYRNLKAFAWLLTLTFGFHLFLNGEGRVLLSLPWQVNVTDVGLSNAIILTLRFGLLLIFAGLLTLTTATMDLTDGVAKLCRPLRKLGVPVHDLAMMATLSLRFLPLLLVESEKLKNAQVSRGASFDGSLFRKATVVSAMLLPLFISALRRAEELAVSMEARYYAGQANRSSYAALAFKRADILLLGFSVTLLAVTFFDKA